MITDVTQDRQAAKGPWQEGPYGGRERSGSFSTLGDQVSKLYDLIAGYHATHLLEIARQLGVREALAKNPGLDSEELAARLDTRPTSTGSGPGRPSRTRTMTRPSCTRWEGLKTLPLIFLDFVLPRMPELAARLDEGRRVRTFAAVARALEARRLLPDLRRGLSGRPTRRCGPCRPASPRWPSGTKSPWGHAVEFPSTLHTLCQQAGLHVVEETSFSRFNIILAAKRSVSEGQ